MLAAIPSIIYGMWGLFVFVPLFQEHIQPVLIDNLGNLPGLELFFLAYLLVLVYLRQD